ncbi:MAG: hypothetical protein KME16_05935 [Scytolyngbya sp. HA4215-MV1]|jgi:hypothetical protein|nr:hypothetical protein [Scytolyngbya sp. HA4215-MV1]
MKGSFLPSTLLSCAVFSCLTLPLAALGSNSVNIEFQRENIFTGRLKDIATPYLGIAGLVSLGVGAVSLSVSEWRRSAHKSTQIETRLLELQQELKEKATLIDDIRLSESYLTSTGFNAFLEPKATDKLADTVASVSETPAPTVLPVSPQAAMLPEPIAPYEVTAAVSVATSPNLEQALVSPAPVQPSPVAAPSSIPTEFSLEMLKSLMAMLQSEQVAASSAPQRSQEPPTPAFVPAPQSFPSPEQPIEQKASSPVLPTYTSYSTHHRQATATRTKMLMRMNELQNQIIQISSQIEDLQNSLHVAAEPMLADEMDFSKVDCSNSVIKQLYHRLQVLELDWMQQQKALVS